MDTHTDTLMYIHTDTLMDIHTDTLMYIHTDTQTTYLMNHQRFFVVCYRGDHWIEVVLPNIPGLIIIWSLCVIQIRHDTNNTISPYMVVG